MQVTASNRLAETFSSSPSLFCAFGFPTVTRSFGDSGATAASGIVDFLIYWLCLTFLHTVGPCLLSSAVCCRLSSSSECSPAPVLGEHPSEGLAPPASTSLSLPCALPSPSPAERCVLGAPGLDPHLLLTRPLARPSSESFCHCRTFPLPTPDPSCLSKDIRSTLTNTQQTHSANAASSGAVPARPAVGLLPPRGGARLLKCLVPAPLVACDPVAGARVPSEPQSPALPLLLTCNFGCRSSARAKALCRAGVWGARTDRQLRAGQGTSGE